MYKIPVISRFYTQGCEDEKVIFSPGILKRMKSQNFRDIYESFANISILMLM
jgi:hypothetical protein